MFHPTVNRAPSLSKVGEMCLDGEAVPGQGVGGGLQFRWLAGPCGCLGCCGSTPDGHVTGTMTCWRHQEKELGNGESEDDGWSPLSFFEGDARNEECIIVEDAGKWLVERF